MNCFSLEGKNNIVVMQTTSGPRMLMLMSCLLLVLWSCEKRWCFSPMSQLVCVISGNLDSFRGLQGVVRLSGSNSTEKSSCFACHPAHTSENNASIDLFQKLQLTYCLPFCHERNDMQLNIISTIFYSTQKKVQNVLLAEM